MDKLQKKKFVADTPGIGNW